MKRAGEQHTLQIGVLSVGAFASVVVTTMLSPLLRPIATTFGISEAMAGQAGTVGAIVSVVAAVVAVGWMDRISRRRWLRGQSVALMAATTIMALAPSFGWLLAGRALAGLGGAVILANCLAAAGEIFPDPARRNRAIGIIVSATTLAIVVGLPALAQIEANAGWRWAVASLLLPLFALFAGSWLLPDAVTPSEVGQSLPASAITRQVMRDPALLWLLAAGAIFILAYIGWLTYFGAYVATDFGASAATLSALFLVAGVAELIANNVTPLLLRRVSPHHVFVVCGVVLAANLLLTGVVYTRLWTVFVATSITSVCTTVLYIAINTILLDARPRSRGAVMALSSAGIGTGAALGALTGGVALAALGSYAATYQVLGLITPLAVVCLVLSDRAARTVEAAKIPAEAISETPLAQG